ncbi:hypothetical protein D3C71_2192760 [compost metagenome]
MRVVIVSFQIRGLQMNVNHVAYRNLLDRPLRFQLDIGVHVPGHAGIGKRLKTG